MENSIEAREYFYHQEQRDLLLKQKNETKKYQKAIKHEGKRFQHDQCDFKVTRNNMLENHKTNRHTEGVTCPACAKVFRSKKMSRVHIGTVQAETDKTTVCPICARLSVNSHYMKKHVSFIHGFNLDINPIKVSCNECGKELANPTYL